MSKFSDTSLDELTFSVTLFCDKVKYSKIRKPCVFIEILKNVEKAISIIWIPLRN